ncbi:MAG TPA: sulfotransferase, partial [Rhizobiales bacterium]|nr:sulfotransferase [Hyphomicrobiales bacterium]
PDLSDAQRIVDKSISSLLHLGTIATMFPNARIICCQRHPMDVAWSAYKQYFNDGALAYTYSFERIVSHQKIYAQALKHWQSVLGDKLVTVRYEDLVSAPEESAKSLISHIDLPWQESCLDFYKSKTPVRTASYEQVRQPIYTTAIGSWKPYEPWLKQLQSSLLAEIEAYTQG